MNITDFAGQIHHILDDYEVRGREPQRVLEIIACQVRAFGEDNSSLCGPLEQIRLTTEAWERGERPDLDSLETIAALVRQM